MRKARDHSKSCKPLLNKAGSAGAPAEDWRIERNFPVGMNQIADVFPPLLNRRHMWEDACNDALHSDAVSRKQKNRTFRLPPRKPAAHLARAG